MLLILLLVLLLLLLLLLLLSHYQSITDESNIATKVRNAFILVSIGELLQLRFLKTRRQQKFSVILDEKHFKPTPVADPGSVKRGGRESKFLDSAPENRPK